MIRRSPALLLAALLSACADQPTEPSLQPQADIDVNDPRGELKVEVKYNGAFYSTAAPVADNDCQLLVDVNVPTWSGYAVGFCERTRTGLFSPGTFSSRPWIYDGSAYPTLVSNIPVVIRAGTTTLQLYDFADWTGIVTGAVTIDGSPAKSPYSVCLSTGGCSSFPKADGNFRLITKPGSGTGSIRNNLGNQLATFSYTATQGSVTIVPAIAASDPRGDLRVEVRYNGAFHTPSAPVADNDCQLLVDVNVPGWSGYAIGFCEKFRATTVVPGTYSSRPWIYDGYGYPTLVSNIPVTVVNAVLTTQVYELADYTSIVQGRILIDGLPARSPINVCLSTGGCSSFPRADGTFKLLTKPGAGTGVIRNNVGTTLGSFSYTSAQGQVVTVPDVAASDPRGTLTVEVRYNGAFQSPATPIADNDCQLLVDVNVPNWSGYAIGFCEKTRTTTAVPGTYSSRPWIYDGHAYPTLVANIPVTVVNGQTTTKVYDLASMTAIVSGKVMVDGQPASSAYRVCLSTGGCSNFPRGGGNFKLITRPGSGTGVVINNIGVQLNTFSYSTGPGEEKPIGVIGGDNTPPVITANASGVLGSGGWYTSDVTVSFVVSDPESADISKSGCAATVVTSDTNGQTFTCSASSAGGSSSKSITVKRDATRPAITFTGHAPVYTVDQQVSIACSASDALSGLAASSCPSVNLAAYALGLGTHTFSASATDNAGNSHSASISTTVMVTTASLSALVRQFVTQHGIANALIVKLEAESINAFINQVEAQRGKAMTTAQADILIALAKAL